MIDLFSEEIHIAVNRLLSQIKKIRARLRKKMRCVVMDRKYHASVVAGCCVCNLSLGC